MMDRWQCHFCSSVRQQARKHSSKSNHRYCWSERQTRIFVSTTSTATPDQKRTKVPSANENRKNTNMPIYPSLEDMRVDHLAHVSFHDRSVGFVYNCIWWRNFLLLSVFIARSGLWILHAIRGYALLCTNLTTRCCYIYNRRKLSLNSRPFRYVQLLRSSVSLLLLKSACFCIFLNLGIPPLQSFLWFANFFLAVS